MSLFGDYFTLPFFNDMLVKSYHDTLSDRAVVKRRRKLEDWIKAFGAILGDDDEAFLAEQYRQKLLMLEKEVKLLKPKLKILQAHGRFDHSELFDLYDDIASAVKKPTNEPKNK